MNNDGSARWLWIAVVASQAVAKAEARATAVAEAEAIRSRPAQLKEPYLPAGKQRSASQIYI